MKVVESARTMLHLPNYRKRECQPKKFFLLNYCLLSAFQKHINEL